MADEESLDEEGGDEAEAEAPSKKRRMPGKKLVLFVVLPVLLLIGGAAGAYFSGLADPLLGRHTAEADGEHEEGPPVPSVFFDLPDMLVNLNTGSRKSSFLKMSVSLEMADEATIERLKDVMPRIIDNFQVYLRELRIEDLSGSAGLERLREELLLRVNAAIRPLTVKDVLFKEMLVQ